MRISLDIDGVLASFGARVVEMSEILWPGRVPKDYIPPDWDHSDIFNKNDWDQLWTQIKSTPKFWLESPDYPDNVNQLFHLARYNPEVDIYYLTSRATTCGDSVLRQTNQWLQMRGLRTANTSVIPVTSPDKKQDIIVDLDIQFSLDDYSKTVFQCEGIYLSDGNTHSAYILDRRWNQNFNIKNRAYSIDDFFKKIGLKTYDYSVKS